MSSRLNFFSSAPIVAPKTRDMLDVLANKRIVLAGLVASSFVLVWGTAFGGRSFGPVRAVLVALPYGDKVGHLVLYGAISFSLGLLARTRRQLAGAALFVIAIGVADEFRQLTEGNRNFSAGDVLANLAGVCLALLLAAAFRRVHGVETPRQESELYIL